MGNALPLYRGERLLLYREKRVSLLYIKRGEPASLYKGRSVSLLYREEVDSSFIKRRECRLLYREDRGYIRETVYTEKIDPFRVKGEECLSKLNRDNLSSVYTEKGLSPPYSGERDSLPSLEKESPSLVDR